MAETPEEFIRRWVATDTAMQNSGDADAYRAMTDGCKSCNRVAKRVESYFRAGGYVRLTGQEVASIDRKATDGTTSLYVVAVDIGPTTYRESEAAEEDSFAGGRVRYEVTIRSEGGSFVMTDYAELVA